VFAAVTNLRGLGASRYTRVAIVTVVDLVLQAGLIVLGLVLVFKPDVWLDPIALGTTPTWAGFLFALTLTTVALTGLESASGLAGEVAVGRRGLRRLVLSSSLVSIVLYVGIALVAITAMPVVGGESSLARNFLEDPLIGVAANLDPNTTLSDVLVYLVGLGAVVTLVAAAQGAMLGLSRLGYLLATNRQVPSALGRLHPTRSTPYVLIGLGALLAIVLVIPLDLEFLVAAYAFGSLLAFTIAHLSVIVLRIKEPDKPRPYSGPGRIMIAGRELPVFAVLGIFGTGLAFVTVTILHLDVAIAGVAWLTLGMGLYIVYRRAHGLDLRSTTRTPRHERPADFEELEYRTALVPIFGNDVSASALKAAAKLIGSSGVVYAVFVLPVPSQLSLDAGLEEEEAHGRSVLESARIQARRAGIKIRTGLIRTRNPGSALVEEAERVRCDVIYWSTVHAPPGEQRIGPTAVYLLAKRPCRVIIETGTPPQKPREPVAA
jgi:APA family basic amino acid/polyamine antiporter